MGSRHLRICGRRPQQKRADPATGGWDLCDGYCYYVGTYEDIDGGQYQIWGPKKYDDDLDAWDFTLCNPGADIRMPISTDDYCNSDCGDTYYVRESLSDEEIDHYAELLYEHSDCRSDEPDDVEAKLWDFGFKPEDWEIEAVCDQIAKIEHMTREEQIAADAEEEEGEYDEYDDDDNDND